MTSKKQRNCVTVDYEHCRGFLALSDYSLTPGKRHHYLRYDAKVLWIAKRRVHEPTPEVKACNRWRAGIEATMSEYDVAHRVKGLWVHGRPAVRFCTNLKAVGVNLFRAAAVRGPGVWPQRLLRAISALLAFFRDYQKAMDKYSGPTPKIWPPDTHLGRFPLKTAA